MDRTGLTASVEAIDAVSIPVPRSPQSETETGRLTARASVSEPVGGDMGVSTAAAGHTGIDWTPAW
jgi:hypothetical protein